jgi:hypothetical protein
LTWRWFLCLASIFFRELAKLLKFCLCDGRRERWNKTLSLRFLAIRNRICSGIDEELFEICAWVGVASYAADWITFVNLFIASSISWVNLRLTFISIFWSTRSWNLHLSVFEWNSLSGEERIGGEALTVKSTAVWSEVGSRRFLVVRNKFDGVLDTKISSISGFLRREVGQYVGPGGARIL